MATSLRDLDGLLQNHFANRYGGLPTTEAILTTYVTEMLVHAQNGEFFEALCAMIAKVREAGQKQVGRGFWKSKEIQDLLALVGSDKGLGLQVGLSEGSPAIALPLIDINHPFFDDITRQLIGNYGYRDINQVLTALKKSELEGTVDFEKAYVSGVYSRIRMAMYMPREMFISEKYKIEEVAVIMCHEFGHGFTMLSMVGQATRVNMWLRYGLKVQESNQDPAQKKVFFAECKNEFKLTDKEVALLEKSKNPATVAVVLVGAGMRPSHTPVSRGVYDYTTCESMADQFASRMHPQAALHLASGLDKIYTEYGMRPFTASSIIGTVLSCLVQVFAVVVTFGVMAALLIGFASRAEIYDHPKARMNRLRLDLIRQLRGVQDLSPAEFEERVQAIDQVKDLMEPYSEDNLSIWETVAKYINPRFKEELRLELLEKDLEELTSGEMSLLRTRFDRLGLSQT